MKLPPKEVRRATREIVEELRDVGSRRRTALNGLDPRLHPLVTEQALPSLLGREGELAAEAGELRDWCIGQVKALAPGLEKAIRSAEANETATRAAYDAAIEERKAARDRAHGELEPLSRSVDYLEQVLQEYPPDDITRAFTRLNRRREVLIQALQDVGKPTDELVAEAESIARGLVRLAVHRKDMSPLADLQRRIEKLGESIVSLPPAEMEASE